MKFVRWCEAVGVPLTVPAIRKAVAGRYVTEEFVAKGVKPATSAHEITALQSYWRWMGKRTDVEFNPWLGQAQSKGSMREGDTGKRPYTDAELAILLQGDADVELADAIRVAALSGMRLGEIYGLRVADCRDGLFNISRAKTPSGVRKVPIHSDLIEIVNRRMKGKADKAWLMHESLKPSSGSGSRSDALSQRFHRYRRRLGVDDGSRIDFHSLRRWFITSARQAGIDRAVVAAVVGHEAGNITDDVYSAVSIEQRRRCVESVRVP
jgi:integrase